MDPYYVTKGKRLRLKGGISKPKKKSSKKKVDLKTSTNDADKELIKNNTENSENVNSSTIKVSQEDFDLGLTETEKKQEQAKREREKLNGQRDKSYKDKLQEYNKYLSNLSEHHEMPKVGPG